MADIVEGWRYSHFAKYILKLKRYCSNIDKSIDRNWTDYETVLSKENVNVPIWSFLEMSCSVLVSKLSNIIVTREMLCTCTSQCYYNQLTKLLCGRKLRRFKVKASFMLKIERLIWYKIDRILYFYFFNGWQLAKMKKSIPDMSLSWNL